MLFELNGEDITKHINESSYNVNSEAEYSGWQDGNFVNHRVYSRRRVKGSFTVNLFGRNGMTASEFIRLLDNATNNNVLTATLYVNNLARMMKINCYYKAEITKHIRLGNGRYVDVMKISIEER